MSVRTQRTFQSEYAMRVSVRAFSSSNTAAGNAHRTDSVCGANAITSMLRDSCPGFGFASSKWPLAAAVHFCNRHDSTTAVVKQAVQDLRSSSSDATLSGPATAGSSSRSWNDVRHDSKRLIVRLRSAKVDLRTSNDSFDRPIETSHQALHAVVRNNLLSLKPTDNNRRMHLDVSCKRTDRCFRAKP